MRNQLKYIYECSLGITHFDKYFEYLESVAHEMPARLAEFASDPERYALSSAATLHDAWLKNLSVEAQYDQSGEKKSMVRIDLLHSSHEFVLSLVYGEVVHIHVDIGESGSSFSVDLLVHEFTVIEPGLFQHKMVFDKNECITVRFKSFDFGRTNFGSDQDYERNAEVTDE